MIQPQGNGLPENPLKGTSFAGPGFLGMANTGVGVSGQSLGYSHPNEPVQPPGDGVLGEGLNGVHGVAHNNRGAGVRGENASDGAGVQGTNAGNKARGLIGAIDPVFRQHVGVYGESDQQGVFGHATNDTGTGVFGNSSGAGFGVRGESVNGTAVQGQSSGVGVGVKGNSHGGYGVSGNSDSGTGVCGNSNSGAGVQGKARAKLAFGGPARAAPE